MEADAAELRVLGCLIEKQRTTPDVYPLSLNALRSACNQTTNRDPIVDYDEGTIRSALDELSRRGWARLASGPGSRAAKFRHLLPEAIGVSAVSVQPRRRSTAKVAGRVTASPNLARHGVASPSSGSPTPQTPGSSTKCAPRVHVPPVPHAASAVTHGSRERAT